MTSDGNRIGDYVGQPNSASYFEDDIRIISDYSFSNVPLQPGYLESSERFYSSVNQNCYQFGQNFGESLSGSVNNTSATMLSKSSANFDGFLPCRVFDNWDYSSCYSYYASGRHNTCQFVNVMDIEDFM